MFKKTVVLGFLFCSSLALLAACGQQEPVTGLEPSALNAPTFSSAAVAQHSDRCADVNKNSLELGADLIQYDCHGKANQRFTFHPVAGKTNTYVLRSESSGLCADVSLSQKVSGDYVVHQWSCHAKTNQQFTLKAGGTSKVFSLVAGHDGRCVSVADGNTDNRANLVAHTCNGAKSQLWTLAGYAAAGAPAPAPAPTSVTVVAAGDIACDPTADAGYNGGDGTADRCHMKATAAVAESLRPDAVLVLGDLQYNTGEYEEFLESYGPSWGRLKSKTYPIPGNHEYDTKNAAGYYKYFGSRAGDPAKGYYSFDLGDWHVVALNTNLACSVVSCAAGSAQERWLRADLAATDKKCVLATMHHPRYSSGRHGGYSSSAALWKALVDGGADLVLAGHDHHYERFAPQDASGRKASGGLRQFIVGTGGKSVYAVGSPRANSEKIIGNTYGVLEIKLGQIAYDWAFVDEAGKRLDTGTASCN